MTRTLIAFLTGDRPTGPLHLGHYFGTLENHLELTRLIARRFNRRYSPDAPVFPQPDALLSDAPALLGTDGQKMSKSRGNAIAVGATAEETARLITATRTDADRHIAYDPVNRPEVSNLLLLGALCQGQEPERIASEVGTGGSAALKRVVIEAVNERFRDIRARRIELAEDPGHLRIGSATSPADREASV